ncbi:hypothetical protein RB25_20505 [Herbaspirillum rubrisubalbicans]|uniref:HEAT repeat domain-containing protein n=1 Tax=Herbaspirillum rubrisubalbicans TaxID=80842 RepID=UPI000DC527E3|nr:HEAT repeat domain-containing protein [Herbaspirillum rubrisubalbicans]RAN44240.1 hypothetical protein RB25_20505 [Herbaspirillum rubrisubalbicans]
MQEEIQKLIDTLASTPNGPEREAILTALLVQDGHGLHEDIVFELGLIGASNAVPAISKAVVIPFQELVRWGNLHEFQRKCAYALARIGTEESREALVVMTQRPDEYLRQYGEEGLSHWPMPYKGDKNS